MLPKQTSNLFIPNYLLLWNIAKFFSNFTFFFPRHTFTSFKEDKIYKKCSISFRSFMMEPVFKPNWKKFFRLPRSNQTLCTIWYHLYNLKNVKNTHGERFFLVKLQAEACNFTKSKTHSWVFFTIFKSYKWYQSRKSSHIQKFRIKLSFRVHENDWL